MKQGAGNPYLFMLAPLLFAVLAFFPMAGVASPIVPFASTGNLYVLDNGCDCVLRISPTGEVSVALSEDEIAAATGKNSANFDDHGLAFDAYGVLFFTENVSDSLLRWNPNGDGLTVLVTESAFGAASGVSVDVEGVAVGDDGFVYVTDESCDCVFQVDPGTGAVSVYVDSTAFTVLLGINSVSQGSPIVAAPGGVIYTGSDGNPDAIFEIGPGGVVSVLTAHQNFSDLDVFMTRHPNGDLIIADDGDTIFRVTPAGDVSVFLSEAFLEVAGCVGVNVDLEGGIAFDDMGYFYFAEEDTDVIYRVDPGLTTCSVFVSEAAVAAVTGSNPDYDAGIAFAPRINRPAIANDLVPKALQDLEQSIEEELCNTSIARETQNPAFFDDERLCPQ